MLLFPDHKSSGVYNTGWKVVDGAAVAGRVSSGTELHAALRAYERSPRMRRASWMSLVMMVTRLAWMAQRLVSSKRPTR